MTQEKIILAYCIENDAVAKEIAASLKSSNFDFELVGCGADGTTLKDAIGLTDANVLLLISDNFLKSMQCMEGGLSYLQKLINSGRTLPLVIDGEYSKDGIASKVKVPTKFERVSSVIKYMNHWQDEYLDMRKQKRTISAEEEGPFNHKLKVVRSISSEVGEFLRFLRESYYSDLETFKTADYQLFFQKFSDEAAYNSFVAQGGSSNYQKETLVAGTGIAVAAAATVAKEASDVKEEALVETTKDIVIEDIVAEDKQSDNIPLDNKQEVSKESMEETASEIPISSDMQLNDIVESEDTVYSEALSEEETIDKLVDDILGEEEEMLVESEIIEEVAMPEQAADLTQIIPQDSVEALQNTASISEMEAAMDDELSASVADNSLALLGATAVSAAFLSSSANETAVEEVKEEEVLEDIFTPLKESELLRASHDLIQNEEIEEGLDLLRKNLEVNPEMVAARYQYAVFLAQFNNNYKAASEQLEVILTKDPKNLPANFFLGELAEAQGDFLLARNYYERVEALNPNFPNLQYKLGLLLSRRYKDKSELAAFYLQKAYEKNPRNIDALYNLGVVQNEGLSMPLDAIQSFKQVLGEKPKHAFVNYDLALAHYKIGDRKSALAYYETACVINKELKTPENDLAFAIVEEEGMPIIMENLVAENTLGTIALTGTAIAEISRNGSTNKHAVGEAIAIQEVEQPAYTLDLAENKQPEEDLGTIDLAELIDQGNKEVTEEAGVDEERLEAEFDAQLGALGAAGLGIAAGAAIKEEPPTIVTAEIPADIIEAPTAETLAKEILVTEPEAVAIPASIPAKVRPLESTNKVVLITGATSGIGKATAIEFAKNGYDLILTGRRFSRLFKLKEEFETAYGTNMQLLPFDVRSAAAVKSAIEELEGNWKNVDILINNAGLAMGFDPIHEGSLEDWDTMIDTNVKGLLYMTRAIAPFMVKRNKGHIINLSSIAGKEVYPNGNVYCASKHAVEALTKAMRIDLHKYNIRVSQVAPGHVEETEFAQVRFHGDREKAKIYEDFVPINSRDVAEMIYFIATRPPHVNIQDTLMMGTQQASALITDKSGRA